MEVNTKAQIQTALLLPEKHPKDRENDLEEKSDKHIGKHSDTFYLRFTVFTGVLLMLQGAAASVWTSPAIIKLKSNDTNVNPLKSPITTLEISALLGIPSIVSLIAGALLPKLSDVIGRKRSLQILGLGISVGTIGLAFSHSINRIIFFICISSCFSSACWAIIPTYITEICEDRNRATYGCLMAASSPTGQLFCYLVGPTFSFKIFTLFLTIPSILFLLFSSFISESPIYCLSNGRKQDCIQCLRKLRSNKSDKELEVDYNEITTYLESLTSNKKFSLSKLLVEKEGRVGVILGMLCILGQYFSGIPIVMSLLAPIFNESGSNLSGNTIAIIVGCVKLFSFIFTSLIIKKTGRRPMLIISAACAGIPVSLLGGFFYLKYIHSSFVQQFQWIPLACVIIYITTYSLGLGPIPLSLTSELFSPDIRSTGMAFVSTASSLILSFYFAAYPVLAERIGIHSCMWMFGGCCFISMLVFIYFIPETQGKGDTEIQKLLKEYKFFK